VQRCLRDGLVAGAGDDGANRAAAGNQPGHQKRGCDPIGIAREVSQYGLRPRGRLLEVCQIFGTLIADEQ
jgi:hypothetical protein